MAALIDPTSVHLKSLTDPTALRILEQNYEYDLLTSAKLLEKYVGKKVRLYQSNGAYQDATLLSTNGPIYEINGQIHMGHSGQVVLPALPENLVSKPTLVWLLRNAKAAAQRVEASYLTGGISWKADYVMIINAADTRSDLTGWVTIDNKSGSTYTNAALKLVAGDINRASDRRREGRLMELAAKAASVDNAERDFKSEGFFEYHLYTLDGRTTVKDNQTKQLALMSAADVPVDKHFIYYGAVDYYRTQYGVPMSNQKVGVYLELKNSKENRLGVPIPKGRVRVYKADSSGSHQLIGEDWVDHTPKDEKIKIRWVTPSTWSASAPRRTGRRSPRISTKWSGDHAAQSQERGGHRRGDRAHARRLGSATRQPSARKDPGLHRAVEDSRAQGRRGQAGLSHPGAVLMVSLATRVEAAAPGGGRLSAGVGPWQETGRYGSVSTCRPEISGGSYLRRLRRRTSLWLVEDRPEWASAARRLLSTQGHAGAHAVGHELACGHHVAFHERDVASRALHAPSRLEPPRPHRSEEIDLHLEGRIGLVLVQVGHEGPAHGRVRHRGEDASLHRAHGIRVGGRRVEDHEGFAGREGLEPHPDQRGCRGHRSLPAHHALHAVQHLGHRSLLGCCRGSRRRGRIVLGRGLWYTLGKHRGHRSPRIHPNWDP